MTTTDLAVSSHSGLQGRGEVAVDRLRASWEILPTAAPQELVDLCIFAEAARETGRAREALDLIRAAAETRLRAEYRLGQLWRKDESLPERFPTLPHYCWELGEVPPALFERVIGDLIPRDKLQGDKSAAARGLMASARISSLEKVEPNIWVAYDGSYYSTRTDGRWTARIAYSLDAARSWVENCLPRSKGGRNHARLDKAYSQARVLADDLSRLKKHFADEAAAAIGDAELMAAKLAESIDRAIRLAP